MLGSMRVSIKYDPDCYRVIVNLIGIDIPSLTLESLYGAMLELAEKEPEVFSSVTYHDAQLKLETHTDNAGKVLASLYMYLHYQTSHRVLSAAVWCELLEREEQRQAFKEWQELECAYGETGENNPYFP